MSSTQVANTGLPDKQVPLWRDPSKRGIVFQVTALCLVFMLGYWIFSNTQANLRRQSIARLFCLFCRYAIPGLNANIMHFS